MLEMIKQKALQLACIQMRYPITKNSPYISYAITGLSSVPSVANLITSIVCSHSLLPCNCYKKSLCSNKYVCTNHFAHRKCIVAAEVNFSVQILYSVTEKAEMLLHPGYWEHYSVLAWLLILSNVGLIVM